MQGIIGLERLPEKAADQCNHFLIIAMLKSLVQRYVVLVDQQNHLLPIVRHQQPTQGLERVDKNFLRHCVLPIAQVDHGAVSAFVIFRQLRTVKQKSESFCLTPDAFCQPIFCAFIGEPVHILKRNENHRILSAICIAQFPVLRNIQAIEKAFVRSDFKEVAQHTHIQRFAESAGACKEVYLAPLPKQLLDQFRFIDIVKTVPSNFFKIIYPNR